jgi:MYXO-CTERM domain-containing protein
MRIHARRILAAGFGAALLCAAFAVRAQENQIGPAQLKDFQLRGQTVTPARQQQPAPQPVQVAPPPPVATQPAPAQPQPRPSPATPPQTGPGPAIQAPAPAAPSAAGPQTVPENPQQIPETPAPASESPSETPENPGGFPWLYAGLGAAALALLAFAFLRSRRRRWYEAEAVEAAPVREPLPLTAREKAVRPEPMPRPWLELSLKAERAQATLTETVVQFELEIRNTGKAAARNLRIDVKMFNAGKEQDKEISAFFRVAGRDSTKCHLPGIAAGTTGVIHGQVTMAREEMKAVQLDEKLLFIPVIGVNALYDWGDAETGQTSRTWVVGRELEQPKMGAFRVDLGPRVWRTVGQRQHKLARQV